MNLTGIVNGICPQRPGGRLTASRGTSRAFSPRMLREHLAQAHDAAGRRMEIRDRQVAWIFGHVLGGQPARVPD